jgi:hypothetical protein
MEFAWKDAIIILFLSTVYNGKCIILNTISTEPLILYIAKLRLYL